MSRGKGRPALLICLVIAFSLYLYQFALFLKRSLQDRTQSLSLLEDLYFKPPTKMSAHAAIVRATLAADAFSLPFHWCYDSDALAAKFSSKDKIVAPHLFNEYHKGKVQGDFTHYGDQTLVLLQTVAEKKDFQAEAFFSNWQKLYANDSYIGYRDHATKETLKNVAEGKLVGSDSSDISAVGRIAPLFLVLHNEDKLAEAAVAQAKLTHGDAVVLAAADFFARVIFHILHSKKTPTEAINAVLPKVSNTVAADLIRKGLDSKNDDDEQAVRSFGEVKTFGPNTIYTGKACGVSGALPSVIHFIAKYESKSLQDALVGNTLVGGDNASRSNIIAAVLAAYKPDDSSISSWYNDVAKKSEVDQLLSKF